MLYLLRCVGRINQKSAASRAAGSGDSHRQPAKTTPSITRPGSGQHIRAREAIKRKHTARLFGRPVHIVPERRECPLDPGFIRVTFAERGAACAH